MRLPPVQQTHFSLSRFIQRSVLVALPCIVASGGNSVDLAIGEESYIHVEPLHGQLRKGAIFMHLLNQIVECKNPILVVIISCPAICKQQKGCTNLV